MAETIRCDCTEHRRPCVPISAQTARYRVRVGPEDQGVVALCAWCYTNGCMSMAEYQWRGKTAGKADRA